MIQTKLGIPGTCSGNVSLPFLFQAIENYKYLPRLYCSYQIPFSYFETYNYHPHLLHWSIFQLGEIQYVGLKI